MNEPNEPGRYTHRSALYWIGFAMMVFGIAYTTSAVMQQVRNTVEGRTYYDWMAVGVASFIVGVAVMGFCHVHRTKK